ncbi:MAG: MFS transporter [Eggerthellales bacterium]|nr:MFS transporter [Eggerthellales bacterium]
MGTDTQKGSNYAWAIAIACVAFYALPLALAANHAGLFTTPLMEEFGWSQTETTLYMSIQPWVAALCTPIAGKLLTKYNPRIVLTIAVVVFGVAHFACAWFTSPIQWDIYGAVYGASAAFWMYIATPTMVNRWFVKHNGTVIGVIGVCVSLFGAFLSPIWGGIIAEQGWQTARMIQGALVVILGGGITLALLRESPDKMGVKPYGYGEEVKAKAVEKKPWDVEPDEGATRAQAMKSPALWLLILMAGLFVISASFIQQIARYASTVEELAAYGAMAVSVAMYASIVGKFGLGWISDHFGAVVAGVTSGVCGLVGPVLMLMAGGNVPMFLIGVGFFGLGYSALNIVPPMTCRQAFGNVDYANVFSIVATGLNVFSGFSALIYATIFDLSGSYAGSFYMMITFYIILIVLSLVIVPMGRKSWAK